MDKPIESDEIGHRYRRKNPFSYFLQSTHHFLQIWGILINRDKFWFEIGYLRMDIQKLNAPNIKDVKHLCRLLHCNKTLLKKLCANPERYYKQFPLLVGDKIRPIKQPTGKLDEILHKVKGLLDKIELPPYVHGGVKGHSPKTNASSHIHKTAVLNFDIADFFPSVKPHQVYEMFYKHYRFPADVSRILTRLVTFERQLPQGSPTSTAIANLIILPLAHRLHRLAEKHGCNYSQFVDDGTISGLGYIERLRPLIDKIIRQTGFRASPKPHKRITMYQYEEQVVTGVRVNRRIDIPREKTDEIQKLLGEFHFLVDKGCEISNRKIMSVRGKIAYAKSLNKEKGERLENRLNAIVKMASYNVTRRLSKVV